MKLAALCLLLLSSLAFGQFQAAERFPPAAPSGTEIPIPSDPLATQVDERAEAERRAREFVERLNHAIREFNKLGKEFNENHAWNKRSAKRVQKLFEQLFRSDGWQ